MSVESAEPVKVTTGIGSALLALLASSSTLICCALPALLVTLGAGAVMSSLVSAVPQLVWVSEHKERVFGFALVMMAVSGAVMWRNRTAPCPVDLQLRNACIRTRKWSVRLYFVSLLLLCVGGWFAFVQPLLG
jgi:hypothetical protein